MSGRWRWIVAALVVLAVSGTAFLVLTLTGLPKKRRSKRSRLPQLVRPWSCSPTRRPSSRHTRRFWRTTRSSARFARSRDALVRRAGDSDFDEIPLSTRVDASGHHTVAGLVPADYTTGAGFDYYVEIEDKRGHAIMLPGGGAAAPQHSWVVSRWTTVELGKQGFENTRLPDAVSSRPPGGKATTT